MNTAKNILIVVLVLAVATLAVWLMMERNAVTEVADDTQGQSNLNNQTEPTPTLTPTPTSSVTPSATPTPNPTVTPETFAQNNWLLESGSTGGSKINMSVNVPQPMTLNFDMTDKSYTGFGGCNSFGGTYVSSTPNNFSFGATVSTKKYCLESSGLENSLFEAMGHVQTFQISAGKLILRGSAETELVYTPAI